MVLLLRPVSYSLSNILIEVLETGVVFDELLKPASRNVVENAQFMEATWVNQPYGHFQEVFGRVKQPP